MMKLETLTHFGCGLRCKRIELLHESYVRARARHHKRGIYSWSDERNLFVVDNAALSRRLEPEQEGFPAKQSPGQQVRPEGLVVVIDAVTIQNTDPLDRVSTRPRDARLPRSSMLSQTVSLALAGKDARLGKRRCPVNERRLINRIGLQLEESLAAGKRDYQDLVPAFVRGADDRE